MLINRRPLVESISTRIFSTKFTTYIHRILCSYWLDRQSIITGGTPNFLKVGSLSLKGDHQELIQIPTNLKPVRKKYYSKISIIITLEVLYPINSGTCLWTVETWTRIRSIKVKLKWGYAGRRKIIGIGRGPFLNAAEPYSFSSEWMVGVGNKV